MNRTELLKIAKPILFNTEMVQAILDGRKTVTRRVVPEKVMDAYYDYDEWCESVMPRDIPCTRSYERDFLLTRARYKAREVVPCEPDDKYKHLFEYEQENKVWVAPSDYLYVRETFAKFCLNRNSMRNSLAGHSNYCFKASPDSAEYGCCDTVLSCKWHPSIHMPKEAARIFLKDINTRVEQVKDVTEEDAIKEGFSNLAEFIKTIFEIYPDATNNTWLWVYEFERVEPDT